jgi:hypothetical protein
MREIMTKKLTLGIMGPGRSGKDEAAEWLAANTTLTYAGTTSVAISREVARRERIGFAEAHAQRHERRGYWRALGDEMRAHNASALAEEMLKDSTLLVGVRARIEMQAIIEKRLCDLVIWVDRPGIPHDPTLDEHRWDGRKANSRRKRIPRYRPSRQSPTLPALRRRHR